ncbi:MAG: thiamine-phosphate kinase [Rikenellaceae bacterium]|nr:thiamine-phosphate kinase [Rikenellaceae bacterium]
MEKNQDPSGEFGWIEQIRRQFAPLVPAGTEGIGDDCAVIPAGAEDAFVLSTDLLVENTHFLKDKISPEDLGYKALAVNLSDLAAMGACPVASLLSIGLSESLDESWRNLFLKGYEELSCRFRVPLLGGDTVISEKLVINVTVIGKAQAGEIKRRKGSLPGDLICVTGNLGDSAAGLKLILEELPVAPEYQPLLSAHYRPYPFLKEGGWLGRQPEVHAMMDVSDGIASDLRHLLEASGVGADIELSRLPISESLQRCCRAFDWNAERLAVAGGEDYVLLTTVDADSFAALDERYRALFGADLHILGKITEGEPEIRWKSMGKPVSVTWQGFSHF